jgi:hypothetical protein
MWSTPSFFLPSLNWVGLATVGANQVTLCHGDAVDFVRPRRALMAAGLIALLL